jgi:glycosyltransferase involved in cell wall biosynthesis
LDCITKHQEVKAFRKAYFSGDAPCVVFLGSWHSKKRPELILELALALRQQVPHIQVLVIGGGGNLEVLEKKVKKFPWIKLLGPMYGQDKFVALSSAKCLIVSGMLGLNIMDAMAVVVYR